MVSTKDLNNVRNRIALKWVKAHIETGGDKDIDKAGKVVTDLTMLITNGPIMPNIF